MKGDYILLDLYDDEEEVIAYCDTLEQIKKACHKRDDETDGEWSPCVCKYNYAAHQYDEIDFRY